MSLREKLDEDLKSAMRAKDEMRTETIRGVRGAVRSREIDEGIVLSDDEVQKVIRSLVKQRQDSIEQYQAGGRDDLVARETAEKAVLEGYLPAAPDAAAVDGAVREVIASLQATSLKDMGRVMKEALSRLGPAADGKLVSAAVKKQLGG